MTEKKLVKQNHWDSNYKNLEFFKPTIFDPIRKIIKHYIKNETQGKTVFEVGCFPGRYLSVFGDLGFCLNGIDLTPRVKNDMPIWLKNNGYDLGNFLCEDFLKYGPDRKYDLVCSFGFIEHFTNFKEVIIKHIDYISPGGLLILTTPNFRGRIQYMLHSKFDKENLERHHLPAMDPFVWEKILKEKGFSILFCGWKGGFDFWAESKKNNIIGKFFIKMLNISGKILRLLPVNSKAFSPYAIIIARRDY